MSGHTKQHTLGNTEDHSDGAEWTSLQTTFIANSGDWDSPNNFPERATMWHHEATAISGNPLAIVNSSASSFYHTAYPTGGAADGDAFTHSFFLEAGTYDFYVLGVASGNRGKLDWDVDGVSIGTEQDWYSAVAVYNTPKVINSVTITGDGYHKITGTINGKNASASGYYFTGIKYWFQKSSDAART